MLNVFLDSLKNFGRKLNITVLGDYICDEWYECSVNRLSPEAGVPILHLNEDKPSCVKPGGAGLVASILSEFVDCKLFCLKDKRVLDTKYQVIDVEVKQTPVKKRFNCESVIYPRIDIESPMYGENNLIEKRDLLFNKFILESSINKPDAVILTDYSKGLFSVEFAQKIIKFCNDNNIHVYVDPKSHPLSMWDNCFLIKPNSSEAAVLSDTDDKNLQADKIRNIINCNYVIITDKNNGVYGDTSIPTGSSICARSSSGGGDCFLAMLTMAFSLGFNIDEAAYVAFDGGRCYVKNNNRNNVLTPYIIHKYADPIGSKIITIDEYKRIGLQGKVVFTNGVFDGGLTKGHVLYLNEAKKLGDKLVIGINTDESTKQNKGNSRPLIPLSERVAVLAGLSCVDFIISFNEKTPLDLIKQINPSMVVKGGDYKEQDIVGHGIVPVKVLPLFSSMSTTAKIEEYIKINKDIISDNGVIIQRD